MRREGAVRVTTALAVAATVAAACATARSGGGGSTALPDVFASLEGSWEGEGTLMGRSAAFTMRWTPRSAGEIALDFTNAFAGADGTITPVLTAHAVYAVDAAGAITAEWNDDRPQRVTIVADATESVLLSEWTAPSETGRTEYRVMPDGSVTVRDWVRSGGELRLFGEATYRRVDRP